MLDAGHTSQVHILASEVVSRANSAAEIAVVTGDVAEALLSKVAAAGGVVGAV